MWLCLFPCIPARSYASKPLRDSFTKDSSVHETSSSAQKESPESRLPSAHKIAIVGAGSVGAAIASSLLIRRVAGEIILVDVDASLCRAQVQDLSDAASLSNARILEGTHRDAGQSDIIVVSAGAKQRDGDTRLDLIGRNLQILKSVIDAMQPLRRDAILLLVANPVDVLTHFAQQLSGLPKKQVLGSGTSLDSVRLAGTLSQKLEVGVVDRYDTRSLTYTEP